MQRYLILWQSHHDRSALEHEEYTNEAEARDALAKFQADFPWNSYMLAKVEAVIEATAADPPGKIHVTYLPIPK